MTRRIRWYSVEPVSRLLPALAKAVVRDTLTPGALDGFLPDSISKSRIEGAFVEVVTATDKVEDPFGNVRTFERVEYRRTEFGLVSEFPQLVVRNPPRSARPFIARLGSVAGNEVAIEAVPLAVMSVIKELEKLVGRVSVSRLVVSGFPLAPNVGADVVISGADDVRDEAERYTKNRFATVLAAALSWRHRSEVIRCELSRGGVSCSEENGDTVERAVRDAVVALAEKKSSGGRANRS